MELLKILLTLGSCERKIHPHVESSLGGNIGFFVNDNDFPIVEFPIRFFILLFFYITLYFYIMILFLEKMISDVSQVALYYVTLLTWLDTA